MPQIHQLSVERRGISIISHLNFTFDRKRYGLVGANGIGKSTLAEVLAGNLEPSEGRVSANGPTTLFCQIEERPTKRVYEVLAEAWDYQGPYKPILEKWLSRLNLEQNVDTLSGGEWMRVRLMKTILTPHSFLILDEPTNHLDDEGRDSLIEFLRISEAFLLISHDEKVLRECEIILELNGKGLTSFTGTIDDFRANRLAQRESEVVALAEAKRQKEKELRKSKMKVERREEANRRGTKTAEHSGLPKILLGKRKRHAQETLGKTKKETKKRIAMATASVEKKWSDLETELFLRFNFEGRHPSNSGHHYLAKDLNLLLPKPLWRSGLSFLMKGNERWRIIGPNGSGKSSLLRLLGNPSESEQALFSGELVRSERTTHFLDQNLSIGDSSKSIFDLLMYQTRYDQIQLRNELAYYGFTKEKVYQPVATLSGGEKLRGALAMLFLSNLVPQILLLDEPTTHLDFRSKALLEAALSKFPGLIVLATLDDDFAEAVGITHTLVLNRTEVLES